MEPLASRMRPRVLTDIVGQSHITASDRFLARSLAQGRLISLILFGPPGTGKTSLARVIIETLNLPAVFLNATSTNKKELETIFENAKREDQTYVVVVDEVHRFNKDRQDLLLQYLESGLITLIGTTTANPYHAINPAIRSRCHLLEFKPLTPAAIKTRLNDALSAPAGLNNAYTISEEALDLLVMLASGDLRYALNNLEICALAATDNQIDVMLVNDNLKVPKSYLDHDEDGHYDAVSALQKSIRGSDVQAALYYAARLIQGGDLESLFRRLLITAYEDIGLGNPAALARTYQAIEACRMVGLPEAQIIISVAIIDLALSPKSKTACRAMEAAMQVVEAGDYEVPRFMRLTPHGLSMEERFPYDRPDLWPLIDYLPSALKGQVFYHPNYNSAYEKALATTLKSLNEQARSQDIKALRRRPK